MSNEEHLIENALTALESADNPRERFNCKLNRMMAEASGVSLDQVWLMAQHVYYSIKPLWEERAIKKDRAWDPLPDFPTGWN